MKLLHVLTFLLVVAGALNWGLVGLGYFMQADWNVIEMILGQWPDVMNGVYLLAGVSALWLVVMHPKECRACMGR